MVAGVILVYRITNAQPAARGAKDAAHAAGYGLTSSAARNARM